MIQIFNSLQYHWVRGQEPGVSPYLLGKKASRQALRTCLETVDIEAPHLNIVDHLYLDNYPEYAVSLAHTEDWGAAIIGKRPKFLSLGIDIEKENRRVSKKIQKFFINSEDQAKQDPLEMWVKKEAAFKAFYPLRDRQNLFKTYVLNDLWLDGTSFGIKGNTFALGQVQIQRCKGLIIAMAAII